MASSSQLLEILQRVAKKPVSPAADESLFESGILDSFALPDLISELETSFGISIPDADLSPRKFETLEKIEAYLADLGK